MGTANETEEQIVQRLAANAGGIIEMLKAFFMTKDKRLDMTFPLIFSAGLAGYACHEAVKANREEMTRVTTKDGRNYYYGDAVNRYLLENRTSVYSFCNAVTGMKDEQLKSIVASVSTRLGTESFTISGMDADSVYVQIKPCWEGIFDNMTAKYCKSPSEWPILFGIVLQNMIKQSMDVGAPVDEVSNLAMECAIEISKMDTDSLLEGSQSKTTNKPAEPEEFVPVNIITDKKIINKVCGKKISIEVLFIVVLVFIGLLTLLALVYGIDISSRQGIGEGAPVFFAAAVLGLVDAMYVVLLGNTVKHRKELTEKYEALETNQQQEILSLAQRCVAVRTMYYNKRFVYGNLFSLKKANGLPTKTLVFEYTPLKDIVWIYITKGTNAFTMENTCIIYTSDGICYKGSLAMALFNELCTYVRAANPECLIGFNKDNQAEYARKYKK